MADRRSDDLDYELVYEPVSLISQTVKQLSAAQKPADTRGQLSPRTKVAVSRSVGGEDKPRKNVKDRWAVMQADCNTDDDHIYEEAQPVSLVTKSGGACFKGAAQLGNAFSLNSLDNKLEDEGLYEEAQPVNRTLAVARRQQKPPVPAKPFNTLNQQSKQLQPTPPKSTPRQATPEVKSAQVPVSRSSTEQATPDSAADASDNSAYVNMKQDLEREQDDLSDESDDDLYWNKYAAASRQTAGGDRSNSPYELSDDDGELPESYQRSALTRIQMVALELYETEKTYVSRLHLVAEEFRHAFNLYNGSDHMVPDDVINVIFSNIDSIYHFHNDFLLPEFHLCTVQSGEQKRIGEVLKSHAPYFKLYAEYIQNYDVACQAIAHWQGRSPRFAKFIADFELRPACKSLAIQHHMLEPIQRLPRYELLLKDYLRHIADDSIDRKDSERALELVTDAATHCNEIMREMEQYMRLFEISRNLWGNVDVLAPRRRLVKEGIIHAESENNKKKERQAYLFNDMLLLCKIISLGITVQYVIQQQLDIYGAKVTEDDDVGFAIENQQKVIRLRASSPGSKDEWTRALNKAIAECPEPRLLTAFDVETSGELGVTAPNDLSDQDINCCMLCSINFTNKTSRCYCRACKSVVCKNCSNYKVPLKFDKNRDNKVCDNCYSLLSQEPYSPPQGMNTAPKDNCHTLPTRLPSKNHSNVPLLFTVSPNTGVICEGSLLTSRDEKTWQRRWFRLYEDNVMCAFTDETVDQKPLSALVLTGHKVKLAFGFVSAANHTEHRFMLVRAKMKPVHFQAQSHQELTRWIICLKDFVGTDSRKEKQTTSSAALTFLQSTLNRIPRSAANQVSEA